MFSLFLNGHTVGSAAVEKGCLEASCPIDGRYIYRLELVSDSRRLPVGVMMPRENSFVLKKQNLPPDSWLCGEILRSLPGESICPPLPFALSHGEAVRDCEFCADALLQQCLRQTRDAKTAMHAGERYVYFPFVQGQDDPMAPFFFCLTCFYRKGTAYAAFKLKNDIPCPI